MSGVRKELLSSPTDIADSGAIQYLKQAIATGEHWYIALLKAIGLWRKAEETYRGYHYQYLISGEAFDWLSLAERLCLEVDGDLPQEEKVNLLFFAKPPIELSKEDFKSLIGDTKYRAYLNYFYGIIVEEALILAVEEEVDKENKAFFPYREEFVEQEAYRRVYGTDMATLLCQFRAEKGYPHSQSITLSERKEFIYWLFKYRLQRSNKEKVASDTKKALDYLQRHRHSALKPLAKNETSKGQ